jgi:hypothetical protein
VLAEMAKVKTRCYIHRLGVILVFLVVTYPALAENNRVNYLVLPPTEYDYPFKGTLVTLKKDTRAEVNESCRTPLAMGLGCTQFKSPSYCVIVVASDEVIEAAGYTPEVVVRHEVGHCNGWKKDHMGARMWVR